MSEIKVEGLDELRKTFLQTFPKKFGGKQMQSVLTRASRPTITAARGHIHNVSGTLSRSLFSWRSRASKPGFEIRNVSARRGKKNAVNGRDAWYGRFVEFGRAAIVGRKGPLKIGKGNGFIGPVQQVFRASVKAARPRPFLGPAWTATKSTALNLIVDGMKKQIEAGAAEARKK